MIDIDSASFSVYFTARKIGVVGTDNCGRVIGGESDRISEIGVLYAIAADEGRGRRRRIGPRRVNRDRIGGASRVDHDLRTRIGHHEVRGKHATRGVGRTQSPVDEMAVKDLDG